MFSWYYPLITAGLGYMVTKKIIDIKKGKIVRNSVLSRKNLKETKFVKLKVPQGNSKEMVRQTKATQKKDHFFKFPWIQRKRLEKKPELCFIITMRFSNGTCKSFIIKTKGSTFTMKGKTYYLYYEEAWYDLSLNQYHLDYFENFCVPINREIQQNGNEAYFSVTPENLKSLINFEYVKALAGQSATQKMLKTIVIILIVIGVGIAILYLNSKGG